jgi:hypothetical protein
MPTSRRAALDLFNFDGVLSLDLDAGVAVIDLTRVTFVDAYALTGLACCIASATGDGVPVRLRLPERYDVRSWLSRMHLGDVLDAFDVRVEGGLPKVLERDRRDNLIELERFRDSQGSDRLASFIWERLQGGGADGRHTRGMDHRGGRGCRDRHSRVAPRSVWRHDGGRGDPAGDRVVCVPCSGPG